MADLRGIPSYPQHLSHHQDRPHRFNSFSGGDIRCGIIMDGENIDGSEVFDTPFMEFGELQTLTVSSFRSTGPVRCFGESQPRVILRGARTVGGSLVFAQFDENAFQRMMRRSSRDEVYNQDEPFFIDQLPPFDIICQGTNEFGNSSMLMVGGVTIGQTGTTLSVHDIFTESTYTYTARFYIPWSPAGSFQDQMRTMWWESHMSGSQRNREWLRQLGSSSYDGHEITDSENHLAWANAFEFEEEP